LGVVTGSAGARVSYEGLLEGKSGQEVQFRVQEGRYPRKPIKRKAKREKGETGDAIPGNSIGPDPLKT